MLAACITDEARKEEHVKRILIAVAAALMLGGAPIVAVQPAALASSVHVCTASGNHYCLGASSLTDGTAITNSSDGRDIIFQDQRFTKGGAEVYRLVFAADTSKCVGFSSSGLAEVRDCLGKSNFTNWEDYAPEDGITRWINANYQENNCWTPDQPFPFLASDNVLGSRLFCTPGFPTSWFVRWTPSP